MVGITAASQPASGPLVGSFRVRFAGRTADRLDEFRLRYRIFVEEYAFEPAERCPGGLEQDEFDEASCAMLLYDAVTGDLAASQRLILPDRLPAGVEPNVEREYRRDDGRPAVDFAALPHATWAEASRTTVAPAYRWGARTAGMPAMAAIKLASIALATALGRTTLFSLSEPATARLIRRLGFPMVRIGAVVPFHGQRAPFRMDLDAMVRSVNPRERLWLADLSAAAETLVDTHPELSSLSHAAR